MSSDKFAYHAAPPASFYAYHLFAASSFGCRWVMPVNWQRPDLDQKDGEGRSELTGGGRQEEDREQAPDSHLVLQLLLLSPSGAGPRLRGGWLAGRV